MWHVVCVIIGGCFGLLIASLIAAASDKRASTKFWDDYYENIYSSKDDQDDKKE